MIIAVDFDGTLCQNKYPYIGAANLALIDYLVRQQRSGNTLILWSCRSGRLLENAIAWCESFGLRFDYINENTSETIEQFGDSRKVYADVYIDDKGQLPDMIVRRRSRYRGGRNDTGFKGQDDGV